MLTKGQGRLFSLFCEGTHGHGGAGLMGQEGSKWLKERDKRSGKKQV